MIVTHWLNMELTEDGIDVCRPNNLGYVQGWWYIDTNVYDNAWNVHLVPVALFFCVLAISASISLIFSMIPIFAQITCQQKIMPLNNQNEAKKKGIGQHIVKLK